MEDEENNVGTEVTTENAGTTEVTETKKSLIDLLNADKELQSQYDKKISDALKTAKAKWEEDNKTKQLEAEKLAKMDEDQKRDYELQQWKERAEKAEKANSISKLQSETIKQANEKGIPLEFVSTINFEYETAETIATKLETLQKAVNKQREAVINEYSKEEPPQTGDRVNTNKSESEMTYEELCQLDKYKK